MNNLKRIFVSIKSQIDHVADDFENHEALAGAAISDLQQIASKTRLHLHRISKMSVNYQQQLQEQQHQAELWSERAIKARAADEQKALQCVKRLRHTQKQISMLEQQIVDAQVQESKLKNDLDGIQEQILLLKSKKEILAARQNRAGLQDTLQENKGNSLQEVQSVFERWEGAVVSTEFDIPDSMDSLAEGFEQQEDELALRMMLDELTESTESNIDSEDNK